jgi:hypothetical protein
MECEKMDKGPTVKKAGEGNKTLLLAGLVFVFLAISWTAYEFLRERTVDEKKQILEDQKLAAEIEKANKKK